MTNWYKKNETHDKIVISNTSLILYHGSSHYFKEFKDIFIKNSLRGRGIFFSNSIKYAKEFGNYIYQCEVNLSNPKVYLTSADYVADSFIKSSGNINKLIDILKEEGHDGVIIENSKVSTGTIREIISFGSDNIRIINIRKI